MLFRDARPRTTLLLLLGIALAGTGLAATLFPRAFPTIVLSDRITRADALLRAESFFRAHDLAQPASRRAVRFRQDDSLLTFVDLAGGGRDTLDALVRSRAIAVFTWSVRAFTPRDPHEARVQLSHDGRITGFERRLAETDKRPALTPDSAQRVAEHVLTDWLGETAAQWHLASSSYEVRKSSGRIDRTFTFERTDRRIAGAPIRVDVVVAGDSPSLYRPYVVIPEAFRRRYHEMRSANELISLVDIIGILAWIVVGAIGLRHYARERRVRWRQAFLIAAVIAALLIAAGINQLPLEWYDYDTAMAPSTYVAMLVAQGLGAAVLLGVIVALTLAAAEAAERSAFPHHLDWWKLWRYRGTREVAGRVAGGYAVGAVSLAYVVVFYLITRRLFGWWVPTELLDDPNQIATPMPWITGIAVAAQAGVWEEALFRALPLSLLSIWVGSRPRRWAWMTAGVVVTAIIFGFAHASYPSWPPYSRGVEIFLDACFWAVLFLQFGILVTVVAHFLYDLTLFGLFAATGTGLAYGVTAVLIVTALLTPALVVAWRWLRQRTLLPAPDEARFAAWRPHEAVAVEPHVETPSTAGLGGRARTVALVVTLVGVVVALATPRTPVRGPPFTIGRVAATAVADSVIRTHGVQPATWTRLTSSATDTLSAWPRLLVGQHSESLANSLATTYAVPAWWIVRYVRLDAPLLAREDEWRVRVRPDGALIDVRHIVPEIAPRTTPTPVEARRTARAALARAGLDTLSLVESKVEQTKRPVRSDVTFTYTDTAVHLPAGAAARVRVELAGTEPVLVRRGVELPETFLREDRDRRTDQILVAIVGLILLVAALCVGAVYVVRRRQPLLDDFAMSARNRLVVLAALSALMLAEGLNNVSTVVSEYDTAVPWSTFVTSHIVESIVLSVMFALLIAGGWLATHALRRRVGISVFPSAAAQVTAYDTTLAGLGLGALIAIVQLLNALVRSRIPPAPTTELQKVVPWVSGVITLPMFVLGVVPLVAIPALVIAGIAGQSGRALRVGLVLALLALLSMIAVPLQQEPASLEGLIFSAAAVVALTFGIVRWGSICVVTWLAAALGNRVLTSLHQAIHAPTAPEQWNGLLAVVASLILLRYLMQLTLSHRERPESD